MAGLGLGVQPLLQFVERAVSSGYCRVLTGLFRGLVEDVLYVLPFDKHLERTVALVHLQTVGVALGEVLREDGVGYVFVYACATSAGEKQHQQHAYYNSVYPVEVELGHVLLRGPLHIISLIHFFLLVNVGNGCECGVSPQVLQIVERSLLGLEDVHEDVAVVHRYPQAILYA